MTPWQEHFDELLMNGLETKIVVERLHTDLLSVGPDAIRAFLMLKNGGREFKCFPAESETTSEKLRNFIYVIHYDDKQNCNLIKKLPSPLKDNLMMDISPYVLCRNGQEKKYFDQLLYEFGMATNYFQEFPSIEKGLTEEVKELTDQIESIHPLKERLQYLREELTPLLTEKHKPNATAEYYTILAHFLKQDSICLVPKVYSQWAHHRVFEEHTFFREIKNYTRKRYSITYYTRDMRKKLLEQTQKEFQKTATAVRRED